MITKETFSHFYMNHHAHFLYFLQKRFSDAQVQDCEDAIADVYFSILKKVEQKVHIENLKAYCKMAIKNYYIRMQSGGNYHLSIDDICYEQIKEGVFEYQDEKWQAYDIAWSQLGEKCQTAFKIVYEDGKKQKDVWQRFGFPSYEAFRKAFSRCKEKFKTLYETSAKKINAKH